MLKYSLILFCFAFRAEAQRPQIPVLCYHQIRDWKPKDRPRDKEYIIPPAAFRAQMKMLADSGYHAILPDQLYDYLVSGKALPAKPILLTFDDTDEDQFRVARPELDKYHFKGVYFIVWNNINKNGGYMTRAEIRQLAAEGNVIGCHTLTHIDCRKLSGTGWETEVVVPKRKLEALTGKPVNYFAFPYGYWRPGNLPELAKLGFKAAFQLDQPRDNNFQLLTIRRIVASGYWSPQTLDHNIKHDFGKRRIGDLANR